MGKTSGLVFDVITPNSGGNFKKSSTYKRTSSPGSFRETVALAMANEAANKINKGLKDAAEKTIPKVRPISLSELKKKNEMTVKELRSRYFGQENKVNIEGSATHKVGRVPHVYYILARTFYAIIARTPYDEDYEYTSTKKVPLKNRKNNILGGYVFRYTKGYHHADKDVVKNEWKMEVTAGNASFSFSMEDFEGFKFESILNKEYEAMAKKLYKVIHSETIDSVNIYNTNSRVDMLEFGEYKKKRSPETKNEIHKGKNRLHGTWHGYSVQAPRGFIALTFNELKETEVLYETKPDELSGEFVRYTVKDIMQNKKLKFTSNVSLDDPIRDYVQQVFDKGFFNEKDILKAFITHGSGMVSVSKNLKLLNKGLQKKDIAEFHEWKKEVRDAKKFKSDAKKVKSVSDVKYDSKPKDLDISVNTPAEHEYKKIKQTPLTADQIKTTLSNLAKKDEFKWIKKNKKDSSDTDDDVGEFIEGRITVGNDWYLVQFDEGRFEVCKFPNTGSDDYRAEFESINQFLENNQIRNIEEVLKTYKETDRY